MKSKYIILLILLLSLTDSIFSGTIIGKQSWSGGDQGFSMEVMASSGLYYPFSIYDKKERDVYYSESTQLRIHKWESGGAFTLKWRLAVEIDGVLKTYSETIGNSGDGYVTLYLRDDQTLKVYLQYRTGSWKDGSSNGYCIRTSILDDKGPIFNINEEGLDTPQWLNQFEDSNYFFNPNSSILIQNEDSKELKDLRNLTLELNNNVYDVASDTDDDGIGNGIGVGLPSKPYSFNGGSATNNTGYPIFLTGYQKDYTATVEAQDRLGNISTDSINFLRDIEHPDYTVSYKVEPAGQTHSYIVTTFITGVSDDDVADNGDGDTLDGSGFNLSDTRLYFTLGEGIRNAIDLDTTPENLDENSLLEFPIITSLDDTLDPDATDTKKLVDYPQIGFAQYIDEDENEVPNTYYLKFIVEANTELETTLIVADNVANAAEEDIIYNIPGMPVIELTEEFMSKIVTDTPGVPYLDLYLKVPTSYDQTQSFSTLNLTITQRDDVSQSSYLDILESGDYWVEDFEQADSKFKISNFHIPLFFDNPRGIYDTAGEFSFSYAEMPADGDEIESVFSGTYGELEFTAPNIPLSENNEFDLTITRNNSALTDLITYKDLIHESPKEIYFNDKMTITLNQTKDREGDSLKVGYTFDGETGYIEPDENGNHTLEFDSGISELFIEEYFEESGDTHNNIFKVLLIKDSEIVEDTFDLQITGNEYESLEYPISSEGEFTAVFTDSREFNDSNKPIDRSGFNSAIMFDADHFNFNLNEAALANEWTTYNGPSVDFLKGGTDTGVFTFVRKENEEAFHHLGIRVEDNAGNVKFFQRKVIVDTKAPSLFVMGDDSIIKTNETPLVYAFDPVTSEIHLIPDNSQSNDQNSTLLTTPTALGEYRLNWQPSGNHSVSDSDLDERAIITLDDQYESNKVFTVELTITDFVGNSSTQNLSYYNPVRLDEEIGTYLSETDDEWNAEEQSRYLSWEIASEENSELSGYNLYREDGNTTALCVDLIDIDLLPHQKADYLLFGVNGSGYESSHEGSFITFSRIMKNSLPLWEDIPPQAYTGPVSEFHIRETEVDGDRLQLNTYVTNTTENGDPLLWSSVDLNIWDDDYLSMRALELASGIKLQNNNSYTARFTLTDFWTDHNGEEVSGDEIELQELSFIYDNEGPHRIDHFMETREDYSYGYGDLLVALSDNQSGNDNLNSVFTADNGSDLIAVVLEQGSEYTHRISGLDDGTDMTIDLNLVDNLGNSSSFSLSGLNKDSVSPALADLSSDAQAWNEMYLNNTGIIPLTIEWTDDRSGIADTAYRLKLNDDIVFESSIDGLESPMSSTSGIWDVISSFRIMPKEEDTYTLEVRVIDHAGNRGEWVELDRKIRFDYFAPSISITPAGGWVLERGSVFYNGTNPIVESAGSDGTEVVNTWYTLQRQNIAGIPLVLDTLEELSSYISEGGSYELYMWAQDVAGNSGKSQALTFSADTQSPDRGSLNFSFTGSQDAYSSGEAVRFTVSMTDAVSGVDDFYIAIGRNINGTFSPLLTENVTGRTGDGYIKFPYRSGESEYSITIPEIADGDYTIQIKAVDLAGNISPSTAVGGRTLIVRNTDERIAVVDFTDITSDATELQGSWKYLGTGELNHYKYRVVNALTGAPVSDWQEDFTGFGSVHFETPLENGNLYKFEVSAVRENGQIVPASVSRGVTIDTVAPQITSVSVNPYSAGSHMILDWDVSDNESGLSNLELILESYRRDESGDIVYESVEMADGELLSIPVKDLLEIVELPVIEKGDNYQIYLENSPASGSNVLVTLRSGDGAENISETYGGECLFDNTPPPRPVILDPGYYINPTLNELSFNWQWTEEDRQSGNSGYRYQVLREGDEISEDNWIETEEYEMSLSAGSSYQSGERIYLAVEALNNAGIRNIGYSDGIVLDLTAPELPAVTIKKGGVEKAYLTAKTAELYISSEDSESGIVQYRFKPGILINGNWSAAGEAKIVDIQSVPVEIAIPANITSGDLLSYRVDSINGAGEISTVPGFSNTVMYDISEPVVGNVTGEFVNDGLNFFWEVTGSSSSVASTEIKLLKNNVTVKTVNISGSAAKYRFEPADLILTDGRYQITVTCENEAGAVSSAAAASNIVILDRIVPEFTDETYDLYVSETLDFSLAASDFGAGVSQIRYRLGIPGDAGRLSDGWISASANSSRITDTFIFDTETLNHKEKLSLSYQVRDRAGNWSAISWSEPILVDHTAPEIVQFDQNRLIYLNNQILENENRYILKDNRIERLFLESHDEESGVISYKWALVPEGNEIPPADSENWSYGISTESGIIENIELQAPFFFENGSSWNVAIRTVNKADVVSEPFLSPVLLVDLAAAEFSVDMEKSGVPGTAELVMNDTGEVFINIDYEGGEYAVVDYHLLDPDGDSLEINSLLLEVSDSFFTVPFSSDKNDNKPGEYILDISVRDHGDRIRNALVSIRLNSPPVVDVPLLITHPARPTSLPEDTIIGDSDGISEVTFTLFDGETVLSESTVSDPKDWSVEVMHRDIRDRESEYLLKVQAVDGLGLSTLKEYPFTVVNTREGLLYTNEVWSIEHQIDGSVIVPPGLELTIAPDTDITAYMRPDHEEPIALIIEENAQLIHEGSASYSVLSLMDEAWWQGIILHGTANLENISVSGALRGITLSNTAVETITGCTFENNTIGLHLYGTSPLISDSLFRGNVYYGIKEDLGAAPVVRDNLFGSNGFDYYKSGGLLQTYEDINREKDNRGNGQG